jgi:beta-xylosidase
VTPAARQCLILVLVLVLVVAVGACADPAASGGGSPTAAGSPSSGSASPAPGSGGQPSAVASPTVPEGQFINPVIDRNFADPFVLEVDGTYYAYATGNLTFNIQVTTSTDLVHWERVREALPRLPLWQPTSKGLTWAPEVAATDTGYVMHYTGRDVQAGLQCLGVAVADDPAGPFVDESTEPLLCQHDLGGSIDSSPFLDADGTRYLLWKSDGNCCGIPVRMFISELRPDAMTLVGETTDLGLAVDAPWERNLIEAPTLLLRDGTYYLFFSANDYGSRNYAAGYATSSKVRGPYVDAEENPILSTDIAVGTAGQPAGPGHQSIIADGADDLWIVYHAWDSGLIGDSIGGRRSMWIDELVFEDGRPVVKGPDVGPQPMPAPP